MDMFSSVNVDSKLQKQLEEDLNAAIKAGTKQAGTVKLLKATINVDCDPSQDNDDDKLDGADLVRGSWRRRWTAQTAIDVADIPCKMDTINSMTWTTWRGTARMRGIHRGGSGRAKEPQGDAGKIISEHDSLLSRTGHD